MIFSISASSTGLATPDRLFDPLIAADCEEKNVRSASPGVEAIENRSMVTSKCSTVIIGAKNNEQLDANLAATAVKLSAEDMAKLDKVSELPSEYPGWMVTRTSANRLPQA